MVGLAIPVPQVLLAVVCAAGGVARAAAPDAQSEDLLRQGVELRRQARNGEALEMFLKAQEMAPSASVLAQIGSVELTLGRWLEAEAHLQQALARHDPPWSDSPRNREMLEKMLGDARRRIARVDVRGTAGAEVTIDGKRVGALPLPAPVHVVAGTIRVSVTAMGRQPFEKSLTLVGGEEATVNAELAPPPAVPVAPAPPPMAAQVTAPRREAGQGGGWRKWTGGALAVAGAAAVGTGIVWIAMDGRTNCNAPPGGFCELVYDTKTQGWMAVGAGVIAVGAGATLFFWKGKEASARVAVGPGGLGVQGVF